MYKITLNPAGMSLGRHQRALKRRLQRMTKILQSRSPLDVFPATTKTFNFIAFGFSLMLEGHFYTLNDGFTLLQPQQNWEASSNPKKCGCEFWIWLFFPIQPYFRCSDSNRAPVTVWVVAFAIFVWCEMSLPFCAFCNVYRLCQTHRPPPSAETAPRPECSPPLVESQQSKEVSSFSSTTSSPWDSPENPFQALKPMPARAQSAPITLPTEPVDPIRSSPAASPPKSVDAFSSVSWSQSQWIAFSDNFAPPRRQGSGTSVRELQRPPSGSGRSSRFLSDDSADAYCKASGNREDGGFSDVFSGITDWSAAPSSKIFTGNIISDAGAFCCACGLVWGLALYFVLFELVSYCAFVFDLKLICICFVVLSWFYFTDAYLTLPGLQLVCLWVVWILCLECVFLWFSCL